MSDVVLKAADMRKLLLERQKLRDEKKRITRELANVTHKINAARMIDHDAVTAIELETFGE